MEFSSTILILFELLFVDDGQPSSNPIDTLKRDSIHKEQKINAPIVYEASDSIVLTGKGTAHLYGKAKINYEKIELTAEIIDLNSDSSLVYARGVPDTL